MPGIFNADIFNNTVFNTGGATPPAVVVMDGGKRPPFQWRRKHPDEIAREQRMVEDYLETLERRERQEKRIEQLPARKRKAKTADLPHVPVLTEALARAASVVQLRRITEHAQAVEQARQVARAETQRRRKLALILFALDD